MGVEKSVTTILSSLKPETAKLVQQVVDAGVKVLTGDEEAAKRTDDYLRKAAKTDLISAIATRAIAILGLLGKQSDQPMPADIAAPAGSILALLQLDRAADLGLVENDDATVAHLGAVYLDKFLEALGVDKNKLQQVAQNQVSGQGSNSAPADVGLLGAMRHGI